MKIFVSICSYRDPLLKSTIDSLFDNKSLRHDIVVGVFEQTKLEDSLETIAPEYLSRPDIRYKRIDPIYSEGVGWARHINELQLKNEDFFYQVDSHMLFDKDWDRKLINDWKRGKAKHNSDRIIIAANCKNFELDSNNIPILHSHPTPKTCCVKYFHYEAHNNILAPHGDLLEGTEDIQPAIHICAGNFFTTSKWVKEVGANPRFFFEGEEQYLTLSSFLAGYHIYHPREISCYHYINTHEYISKQWYKPIITMERYSNAVQASIAEWNRYLEELDEECLEKYYEYSGVDYINKRLDERAKTYSIHVLPPEERPPSPPVEFPDTPVIVDPEIPLPPTPFEGTDNE